MYEMIIIGAGPAGISIAVEARHQNIASGGILILEKAPQHSFSIRKYYPENKLVTANYKGFEAVCTGVMCIPNMTKSETISYLDEAISINELSVNYEETVWKIEHFPDKEFFCVCTDKGTYEARVVIIAIGILGKPNKPEYQLPASLKDRLLFEITSSEIRNSRVLVVGGGDSASEYAQYLVQQNNEVTLSYRRGEFSRMNEINLHSLQALAEQKKISLLMGSDIERVEDRDGRPLIYFKGDFTQQEFDFIVYALGGTTPHNFLKAIGIEFIGKDPALKEGHETNIPGLFLVGDLSAGTKGGSIIWAFNSANTAMKRIIQIRGDKKNNERPIH